jgi:hypothetical protein
MARRLPARALVSGVFTILGVAVGCGARTPLLPRESGEARDEGGLPEGEIPDVAGPSPDGGNLALLTSVGGLPGSVLFQGTMPMRATAEWLGVDVTPSVSLQGGVLYYLVEQAQLCSQSLGGTEFIEYHASTLGGPWTTSGVGSYTSHVIGTCD